MDEMPSCGRLIKQISEEMRKDANNNMRSLNITAAQLGVLLDLNCAPEKRRSLKELEQSLHVAQSTAAGIVVRLEQKGFVEGSADPADKRIKLVRITAAGSERVADAKKDMLAAEEKLLSGLTQTERDIFYVLLKKVCDCLK